MKRIILLVMSFAVSMCLLVGCGDSKSDTYPEVTSEPVATSTTYSEQEQYYLDNYYRAKHILIMTENRTSLEAKELCDDLYEQAQNGKDFDLLIQEYSEDPGCAKNPNGYFFTDGQMVIEFENAVKSIDAGEFTTCKSDYGYHVVQRLALDETREIFEEGYKNSVTNNANITENSEHFNITRTEFIKKYDELYDELYDNEFKGLDFADYPSYVYDCDEDILSLHPNAYKMYSYDATLYTSGIQETLNKFVQIIVDKDDNVINISFIRLGTTLQTSEQLQHYMYVECTAVYMAITGETNADTAKDALYEAYCSPETGKKDNYEYGFIEKDNYDTSFNIRVINQ